MTAQKPLSLETPLRQTAHNAGVASALQNQRLTAGLIVAWILSMIALPVARWTWGDALIPSFSTLSVVLQCLAVICILWERWGTQRALMSFAVVAALTWAIEWLGSTTGFPFGTYHYTGLLQPQVSGVPLLIPLAWLMMLGPSWAIAYAIVGQHLKGVKQLVALAVLTGAAMTAWDLYLDPQMVGWGFWIWDQPGVYFGIPLVNFAGWFTVAAAVTLIVRPRPVPLPPLLAIYAVVWVFQAIGLSVFWGQVGPALFGFVAMGSLLALAVWRGGWSLWTR